MMPSPSERKQTMTGITAVQPALIESLTAAAHEAGGHLLEAPRPAAATTMTEFRRAFSQLDDATSAVLAGRLAAISPGVPVVDDMRGEIPETGEAWVVDAVDGAVQFMHGLPQWCISVAFVRDGRAVVSVLHSPLAGETYAAGEGLGATLNGQLLRPAGTADMEIALVTTSHPPFTGTQPEAVRSAGAALAAVLPRVGAVRNLGPTSWQVADVAGGRLDAFWMFGRDPGNLLGAALIAREAGLAVTDTTGRDWTPRSDSVLIACPALREPLCELLAAVRAA
jgi:myo-inositol-1(or 4)-monophosphatase